MVGVITAADAAAARKVLGVDAAGDGGKVFLSSVPNNYLSIQNANDGSGNQTLTAGTVPVTLGGTGSNTAPMVAVITLLICRRQIDFRLGGCCRKIYNTCFFKTFQTIIYR